MTSWRLSCLLACAIAACGPNISHNNGGGDGGVQACSSAGATRSCYDGASGTEGVGPCHGGTQTCDGTVWGACTGEQVPTGEVCGNGVDDNCNGMVDENVDMDGDGFTTCGGDCCDSVTDGCGNPALVNPGAFEVPGNNVDDDCDGKVDESSAAPCDMGLASNSTSAMDFAKAIELCETTTMADRTWGVIDAQFLMPDGQNTPNAVQHAIRPSFGSTTVRAGSSFAVLSTGHAAAPGQMNPAFASFQDGTVVGTSSGFPQDWYVTAHGSTLPNAPGCPPEDNTVGAQDPVMLQMHIRVPTNAASFKMSVNFMSSEYPEWVCSPYNDFFVVLLDSMYSGSPANPSDKNLAVYTSPSNMIYPVGVNLAYGDTGVFQQCANGQVGCAGAFEGVGMTGNITTCTSNSELVGTGMDPTNPAGFGGGADPGYCGSANQVGGGTGWLVTSGNVKGGEIITLRIALWDTSDGFLDSIAIIDNFQWSLDTSMPGTVIQ
jgi:hypothetical protein